MSPTTKQIKKWQEVLENNNRIYRSTLRQASLELAPELELVLAEKSTGRLHRLMLPDGKEYFSNNKGYEILNCIILYAKKTKRLRETAPPKIKRTIKPFFENNQEKPGVVLMQLKKESEEAINKTLEDLETKTGIKWTLRLSKDGAPILEPGQWSE